MKVLIKFCIISALLISSNIGYSACLPIDPCYEYNCNAALCDGSEDPFNVPFDGGISLLIAGGAALGVFGLKKKKALK
jgi:hypothetical protein